MPTSSSDEMDSPIRMVSIAHGNLGGIQNSQRQLSWSDVNDLMDQQKAMHERQKAMQQRIETLEQQPIGSEEEKVDSLGAENGNAGDSTPDEEVPLNESQIEARYDKYELPESTYTLLMTENLVSIPFATGIIAAALSMMCLVLAFINELDNGTPHNPLGLPAGVQPSVRMAQYLGLIIGVLMEDEIPQALELIGKGAEQKIAVASTIGSAGDTRLFSMKRVVLPALLRMVVGYTFLCCLFLTVVQESTVLDIFFDVLALEFVERIDDVIIGLSKRGFFGRELRVVTNNRLYIETSRESHTFRRWTKRFIRFVYIFNVLLGIVTLTYVTITQQQGHYRCKSVLVAFGDALWEEAFVTTGNVTEKRLLIYSHFNGIYKENGTHAGRPRYTEQNKEDGDPFQSTIGAEIVYCEGDDAWVLRHKHIRTALDDEYENECSWLLRSPETESYDIIELAEGSEWFVWKGLIESDYKVSIECNDCNDNSGCNYNGKCLNEECDCDDDHFGIHCQFQRPCHVIRSEKDNTTTLELLGDPFDDEVDFVEVYGRPMYVIHNMSGKPESFLRLAYPDDDDKYFNVKYPDSTGADGVAGLASHRHFHTDFFADDDFFELNNETSEFQELLKNYTFVLQYTGRRWYGRIIPPGITEASFKEEEHHAFWDHTFSGLGSQDNSTLIISAPTSSLGSPVGVDFYEMRRRNVAFETGIHDYDYSPYGVLIPLVEYEGSGFFHCNKDD